MKQAVIIIVFIILIVGFWFMFQISQEPEVIPMGKESVQKVQFITSDEVQIVGNFYPSERVKAAVLALHMMPTTKESWDNLAKALARQRVTSLAIDLRGHGESTNIKNEESNIKNLDYRKFSDEEHQASKLDVEAALEWLEKETGLPLEKISVVGGSIGANLTLQALFEHPEIKKGVALSPGLNYRGIQPKQFVQNFKPDQAVFYATSKDDGDNATKVEELFNATSARKEWKVYDNAGHGTTMLERTDDLLPSIVEFISQ